MKIGDLVMPVKNDLLGAPLVEELWRGIVIDWEDGDPVVFGMKSFLVKQNTQNS